MQLPASTGLLFTLGHSFRLGSGLKLKLIRGELIHIARLRADF
jgi:hypothetical protein